MGRETFDSENARRFIERMLAALAEQRMTRAEMEAKLFASKTKVLNYIRHLHGGAGAEKRIYVCKYLDMPNGGRNPQYAVGNKRDAKPLGSRTMSERWARIKSDPAKHAQRLAKLRAKARERGVQPRRRKASKNTPASWAAVLGI